MKLYAESSAVLAWILGETGSEAVRLLLANSELVVTSELTLAECDRALTRRVAAGELTEEQIGERRAALQSAAEGWSWLRIERDLLERCGQRFPLEPVRTMDAIHLLSALEVRAAFSGLAMLSLDARLRKNAAALGFRVVPG